MAIQSSAAPATAGEESKAPDPLLQTLMQAAMRRLHREFHQILSSNRDHLDPDSLTRSRSASSDDGGSSDDEIHSAGESIGAVQTASATAMEDLRDIANAMVVAGYGRECVQILKFVRKSIVDEGLYRLGFERLTLSQLQKLDSELLDLKVRSWLGAAPVAVRSLFSGERTLCDHVFAGSDSIRNACFADISQDAVVGFLAFPEQITKLKRSPEKLFRILDLYDAMAQLWPDIDAVFFSEAAAAVRSQTLSSILKISECARVTLADFQAAIQKDSAKSAIATGGVHPLTRYVMNYIVFLAEYEAALDDIFADFSFEPPAALSEPLFDAAAPNSPSSYGSPRANSVAPRVAWLVLVPLCKMDTKAESYRDVAQSYLFLANNLQYAVNKVSTFKNSGDDCSSILRGLEVRVESQRHLLIDQLNYISTTYQQIQEILRITDVSASEQFESASESSFMWQELGFDDNLRALLEGTVSVYKLAKVAEEKVREKLEARSQEVKALDEKVTRWLAEKQHIVTLRRSALSLNGNEVLQAAENGLREVGIDVRFNGHDQNGLDALEGDCHDPIF